jgi:hypothetical protein
LFYDPLPISAAGKFIFAMVDFLSKEGLMWKQWSIACADGARAMFRDVKLSLP